MYEVIYSGDEMQPEEAAGVLFACISDIRNTIMWRQSVSVNAIQKVNNKYELCGAVHGTTTNKKTICGKKIKRNWCIFADNNNGIVTCKNCLKVINSM